MGNSKSRPSTPDTSNPTDSTVKYNPETTTEVTLVTDVSASMASPKGDSPHMSPKPPLMSHLPPGAAPKPPSETPPKRGLVDNLSVQNLDTPVPTPPSSVAAAVVSPKSMRTETSELDPDHLHAELFPAGSNGECKGTPEQKPDTISLNYSKMEAPPGAVPSPVAARRTPPPRGFKPPTVPLHVSQPSSFDAKKFRAAQSGTLVGTDAQSGGGWTVPSPCSSETLLAQSKASALDDDDENLMMVILDEDETKAV